jgi:release factor glutamine methyltransferase
MESLTTDVGASLRAARQQLSAVANPGLEAQLLLGLVLNQTRTAVLTHPERQLTPDQSNQFQTLLNRRSAGEPLPYLLGHWEFFGLDLLVTPAVLIPRPETELLVEYAITWLQTHPRRRLVADVGVGSGAISLALARSIPGVSIIASDRSRPALRVAQQNISRHGLSPQISLVQTDLLSACRGPFDLVCANLPYIPTSTLIQLDVARHEPVSALDGGVEGLTQIERLLSDSPRWTAAGSCLLLEIEAGQGDTALNLTRGILPSAAAQVYLDPAGFPRLLRIDIN